MLSPQNIQLLLAVLPIALAAPAAVPVPAPVAAAHPMITARASLADREARARVEGRDIIDDITGAADYLTSVIGNFPSYVASGVPDFFQGFPTGDAVKSSLGLNDDDLDAAPTQVLNIP